MVQGIMELLFDAAYLVFALVVGIYLIVKGKSKFFKMSALWRWCCRRGILST